MHQRVHAATKEVVLESADLAPTSALFVIRSLHLLVSANTAWRCVLQHPLVGATSTDRWPRFMNRRPRRPRWCGFPPSGRYGAHPRRAWRGTRPGWRWPGRAEYPTAEREDVGVIVSACHTRCVLVAPVSSGEPARAVSTQGRSYLMQRHRRQTPGSPKRCSWSSCSHPQRKQRG